MKFLEDSRLIQLTSDLTEAVINSRSSERPEGSSGSSERKKRNRRRNPNAGGKGSKQQPTQYTEGSVHSNLPKRDTSRKKSTSTVDFPHPPSPSYHFNPTGYTSNIGGTSSSSCRVIYGKIEAYTTKRAGSDKKTAHEVGERYAHEMYKLNEAVEELKRKHLMEKKKEKDDSIYNARLVKKKDDHLAGYSRFEDDTSKRAKIEQSNKKSQRRKKERSCSFDYVPTHVSSKVSHDNVTDICMPEVRFQGDVSEIPSRINANNEEKHVMLENPIQGILKQPSNSRRWRATSFDISTGPSAFHALYNTTSSEGSVWCGIIPTSNSIKDDLNTHPLIPQTSLYQSSLGDSTPNMAPRRLVTDLILTLNASFPDYDFGDARPSDFCTLPVSEAVRRINENLNEFASTTDRGHDFLPRFWSALDDVVFGLKDAEIYSYAPRGGGGDDDPLGFLTATLATGSIGWSSNSDADPVFQKSDTGMVTIENCSSLNLSHMILPSPTTKSEEPALVTLWSMNYFFVSRNKKRIVLFACVQTMRYPHRYDFGEDGDDYLYGENDLVFDEARRGKKQDDTEDDNASHTFTITSGAGDESVMIEDGDFDGVDVDVDEDGDAEDEDQVEKEFDTGALNRGISPPHSISD